MKFKLKRNWNKSQFFKLKIKKRFIFESLFLLEIILIHCYCKLKLWLIMKTKFTILLFFVLSSSMLFAQEPFIGEIRMFAGNFAPRGWAFCDGQTLSISQYSALFSLLGTNYGGDGRTTFNLPDLRGRTPVHVGQGNNMNEIRVGDRGGSESKELRKIRVFEEAKEKSYETYTVKSSNSKMYTRDPYLGVSFIIALHGIFPSRS